MSFEQIFSLNSKLNLCKNTKPMSNIYHSYVALCYLVTFSVHLTT